MPRAQVMSNTQVNPSINCYLAHASATDQFGKRLAGWVEKGDNLLLEGNLGSGKSCLARACIQAMPTTEGLCSNEEVPSPTFTYVQIYERRAGTVFHFDLYRLSAPEELYEIGWEDAEHEGICLIEWPEHMGYLAPSSHLKIKLAHGTGEKGRHVFIQGQRINAERWADLEKHIKQEFA